MKRFLIVLALVAVAGATYIATAPGGQTVSPTAAQFNALQRRVVGLERKVTGIKALLRVCMASSAPITRRGDWQTDTGPTFGYSYQDPAKNGGSPFPETALDITKPSDPTAMWITGGGPKCGAKVGTARRR